MVRTISPPVYLVKRIGDQQMELDGSGSCDLWKRADLLTDFSYPWNEGTPSATHFRALWDSQFIYFLYQVEDPGILNKADANRPVEDSDRVEIFFKTDDQLNPYYSLEMDAHGRVLSTKNRFYRKIDMSWKWPKGHFSIFASTNENGYSVEGKISLASLRQLNLMDDRLLKAGLFRGEYFYEKNSVKEIKWISWVQPDSKEPDFHVPSSFGVLELTS